MRLAKYYCRCSYIAYSLVAKMCTSLTSSINRALKHLTPLIEERMKMQDKYGKDYPGKPVCMRLIL
jgi:hypothetical protein